MTSPVSIVISKEEAAVEQMSVQGGGPGCNRGLESGVEIAATRVVERKTQSWIPSSISAGPLIDVSSLISSKSLGRKELLFFVDKET